LYTNIIKERIAQLRIPIFLVGNKIDLIDGMPNNLYLEQKQEEIEIHMKKIAKKYNINQYFLISCKNNENLFAPFDALIEKLNSLDILNNDSQHSFKLTDSNNPNMYQSSNRRTGKQVKSSMASKNRWSKGDIEVNKACSCCLSK